MAGPAATVPRNKREEAGTLDPTTKKGQAQVVGLMTEALYNRFCGPLEGGKNLYDLEQDAAEKIAEINPDSATALTDFKKIMDGFLDKFEAEYPFLRYNYQIKYTEAALKKIQQSDKGEGKEGGWGDYAILNHEKIKGKIRGVVDEQVGKMVKLSKKTIEERALGGERPGEAILLGENESGRFNNAIVEEMEKHFAGYLETKGIAFNIREVDSASMSPDAHKKIVLNFSPILVSEFTGKPVKGSKRA